MLHREFHISRAQRERYNFDESFFTLRGNTIFANFRAAQMFAEVLNAKRRADGVPESRLVRAAELNAMGLLHEIYHVVIAQYQKEKNPGALQKCEVYLQTTLGALGKQTLLTRFCDAFPAPSVYRGSETVTEYLQRFTEGTSNREVAVEELMLVWLQNQNPALSPIADLIDDTVLRKETSYVKAVMDIDAFFETQPRYGDDNETLFKLLLAPILASPNDVMGQLQFIIVKWEAILKGTGIFRQLLMAVDFIKEEGKFFQIMAEAQGDRERLPAEVRPVEFFGWGDKETPPVPTYQSEELFQDAPEKFSPDLNWMPRLVLMAKNAYVWLDQLSKKYQREIKRLDQIPDNELQTLAARGFTGLWLIGVWERSIASRRIKHLNGNTDAVASAYSLQDYNIARELGGNDALLTLRERAKIFGIRLASDMVPNHFGIDSRWVIEHPDWFLSVDYPPYPNYTFYGPDLSTDDRVGIFIEDGYWRKSDAAVTFARLDRWTGDVKFIYHGNDGTSMPWNDTAQLNFLRADVREAVIQTILHVARLFPVIRFDAAMVLAKQHIQRLWFPEPGKGGAIPSRAAFSMTKEQFDALMPVEFWREVVDRVQVEAPDTLLLAEAFWMLEGYFVRTLGMHRVYNSAFMHMFKKEENDKYRTLMKNTLEYDPRILKRYVNFMSNPDEETAVNQFGKDDKYFGTCVVMVTMPGLPMFGHGQIEGFTERYGMEYQRAYYNETPDEHLIARHEREIFPLLKKRYLFAEVDHFLLYDVVSSNGVNENVFAYSNRYNDEKALVVYHNKFDHVAGWIRLSVPTLDDGRLVQRSLAEGLQISPKLNTFTIFRDAISGLEYIRSNQDLIEQGLFVELNAFKYAVYLDWREVVPTRLRPYDKLADLLGGRGVPSIDEEVLELSLRPVHAAFQDAVSAESLEMLKAGMKNGVINQKIIEAFKAKLKAIGDAKAEVEHNGELSREVIDEQAEKFTAMLALTDIDLHATTALDDWRKFILDVLPEEDNGDSPWRVFLVWLFVQKLDSARAVPMNVVRDWNLEKFIVQSFKQAGIGDARARSEAELIWLLVEREKHLLLDRRLDAVVKSILESGAANRFIQTNVFQGDIWYNKEQFEALAGTFFIASAIETLAASSSKTMLTEKTADRIAIEFETLRKLEMMSSAAGFRLKTLIENLEQSLAIASAPKVDAPSAAKPVSKKSAAKAPSAKKATGKKMTPSTTTAKSVTLDEKPTITPVPKKTTAPVSKPQPVAPKPAEPIIAPSVKTSAKKKSAEKKATDGTLVAEKAAAVSSVKKSTAAIKPSASKPAASKPVAPTPNTMNAESLRTTKPTAAPSTQPETKAPVVPKTALNQAKAGTSSEKASAKKAAPKKKTVAKLAPKPVAKSNGAVGATPKKKSPPKSR